MSETPGLVVAGTLRLKRGYVDEARRRVQHVVDATQRETGCVSYRFFRDPGDERAFFIFEEWSGEDALDLHLQTDRIRDFGQFLRDALDGPLDLRRYQLAGVERL